MSSKSRLKVRKYKSAKVGTHRVRPYNLKF